MTDIIAQAQIQQMNLGYDSAQDRLLLKIGMHDNTEMAVWLTRRVVKTLWLQLQGTTAGADMLTDAVEVSELSIAELMDKMPEAVEAIKQRLDFVTHYENNRVNVTEQPFLATLTTMMHQDDGSSTLEVQCVDSKTVKIVLNMELSLGLSSMLQLATKEAGWDLLFTTSHYIVPETSHRPVLH